MKPVGWGDEATPKVVQDLRTMLGGGLTFRDNINCAIVTVDCQHNTETRVANPLQTKPIAFIPFSSMAITTIGGRSNESARPIDGMPVLNTSRTDGFLGLTVRYELSHSAPYLFLRKSANQAANGSAVTWDTFMEGSGTTIANGVIYISSSSQIKVTEPGLYQVAAHLAFTSNATGTRYIYQQKNGSSASGTMIALNNTPAISGDTTSMDSYGVYNISTTDYVQVFAQSVGAAVNVLGNTTFDSALRVTRLLSTATPLGRVTGILVGG